MINARNLAAILGHMGADVESAFLELTATTPSLDARMRLALYPHQQLPKLRYIESKRFIGYSVSEYNCPRTVCLMHAADTLGLALDDEEIVQFLKAKFSEYNWKELIE